MRPVVCVVGSFMMDLIASAPRRPMPGETVIGTGFDTYLGGKGFNQAIAAARAGACVRMVGRLGGDEFGTAFRNALQVEEVDHSGVVTDHVNGTGVGLPVLEPGGQNSIIVVPRANAMVDLQLVRDHAETIAAADALLLQLELPTPAVVEAARIAHQAGTRVVLNPAPCSPFTERSYVDVIVPNEVELRALAGLDGGTPVEAAALHVRQQWKSDVVVTLGAAGALALPAYGDPEFIPAHPVAVVDTIGAGDTFCAYFATALASAASVLDAARRANVAAALSVTRRGGADSAPYRHEVDELAGTPPGAGTGAATAS